MTEEQIEVFCHQCQRFEAARWTEYAKHAPRGSNRDELICTRCGTVVGRMRYLADVRPSLALQGRAKR